MNQVINTIRNDRVVAVIRAARVHDPVALCHALVSAGIRSVEFTFTIPDLTDVLRQALAGPALVGAGTVLHEDQAIAAIEAGARFIVSPTVRPNIAHLCAEREIPCVLGAFTPSEIALAHDAGAAAVKLFPAGIGGPRYLRELSGPFPDVQFIPSGGVDASNAREFLAAGALGLYVGSSLAPAALVESGNHDEISRRAASFISALSEAPAPRS